MLQNVSRLLTDGTESEADKYVSEFRKSDLDQSWKTIIKGEVGEKILTDVIAYLMKSYKKTSVSTTLETENSYAISLRPLLKGCSYLKAKHSAKRKAELNLTSINEVDDDDLDDDTPSSLN